jgi:peptide/nickel transport system permease protein
LGVIMRKAFRFALRSPLSLFSIAVLLVFFVMALRPQWFAPYDPYKVSIMERLQPPSSEHLFGTDEVGRDILSRVVYGARISVQLAFIVLAFSLTIGFVLGSLSGYFGGMIDSLIMRFTDMVMAFPYLILAMAISAALGPGIINATIAISLVWWTLYVRLIRATILSVKKTLYVEASIGLGAGTMRLLRKHIWPECISPIVVRSTMDIGLVTISAASLSFIGLGAQAPMPEWGAMLSNARPYILDCWWYTTFPGLAIFLMVFSFNVLGDELREILDPRQV